MNIISMFKFWQIYSYSVATQIWRICAIIKDTSDHLTTVYKKQDTPNKIFFPDTNSCNFLYTDITYLTIIYN